MIKSLNNTKFEVISGLLIPSSAALFGIHFCIFLCVKKNASIKNAIQMYSLLNNIHSVLLYSQPLRLSRVANSMAIATTHSLSR
jgi:hypothetical protein